MYVTSVVGFTKISHWVYVTFNFFTQQETICQKLKCDVLTEVIVAGRAEILGYEFRPGVDVVAEWTEEGPTFGKVQCIIKTAMKLYLVCQLFDTLYFRRQVHAYAVKEAANKELLVIEPYELFHYRPVHATQLHDEKDQNLYISVPFAFI